MLRSPALFHQWAFLVGVFVICVSFTPGQAQGPGQYFSTPVCQTNADCTSIVGAECLNTTEGFRCSCNTERGYKKVGSSCRVDVDIGDKCNNVYAFCGQPKSECVHAGDLSNDRRCRCIQDYVAVNDNSTYKCARVLTKQMNPACKDCINNDGTCYEFFDKTRKCKCPISRMGDECEKILVNVKCDRFSLDVCYEAHPSVNITSAHMYTHGFGTKSACRAYPTTTTNMDKDFCPLDRLRLTLDLNQEELARCGVSKMSFDSDYIRYVAMIDVSRHNHDTQPIIFKTYCEYQYRQNAQVESAVVGVNSEGGGNEKRADAKFYVQDHLGRELKSGDTVRIGDDVKLVAMVTNDGTYSGIHVRRCVASSSPQIPDPKATTRMLYEQGCPAKDQPYIPSNGRWRRILGRLNQWTTGLFPMFKLPQGTSVYLHCTFRFCIGTDTKLCVPNKCEETTVSAVTTKAPAAPGANPQSTAAAAAGATVGATTAAAAAEVTTANPPAATTAGTVVTTGAAGNNSSSGKRRKRDLAQQVLVSDGNEAQMTFAVKIDGEEVDQKESTGIAKRLGMSNAAFVAFLAGIVIILLLLMVISAVLLVRMRKNGSDGKVGMSERPQVFPMKSNNHLRL